MDFGKQGDDINLLLLVASGVTNLLSFLPKLRGWLVQVKPWLQGRSKKSVYLTIIFGLKLQERYDYRII